MAIQKFQGSKGVMGRVQGAVGGAEAGSAFGPYGAVIGGVLGAAQSNPNIEVAKVGLDAMGRKKAKMDEEMANDPLKILQEGKEALDHPDVPEDIRQIAAGPIIAAETHGQHGLETSHLQFPGETENAY